MLFRLATIAASIWFAVLPGAHSQGPTAIRDSVVSGHVVDASTRRPVAGATVKLNDTLRLSASRSTTTDGAGRYAFASVMPGSYTVSARAQGFAPGELGRRWPDQIVSGEIPTTIDLREAETLAAPDIVLFRFGSISGRVSDGYGDPAPDVRVRVLQPTCRLVDGALVPLGPSPFVVAEARTDDVGHFLIETLPEGPYFLDVVSGSFSGNDSSATFRRTFFPAATRIESAAALFVQGGRDHATELPLEWVPPSRIGGTVKGEDGPVMTADILLRDESSGGPSVVARTVVRDGRFDLWHVPPGQYTLEASSGLDRSGVPTARARRRITVPDAGSDSLQIVLAPVNRLRGRVVVDGDSQSPRVATITVSAIAAPGDDANFVTRLRATPSPDSTFELAGVAGRVLLRVASTDPTLVLKRIELDGQDVTDIGVDVAKARGADLAVYVSTHRTTLRVRATDDRGQAVASFGTVVFTDDESSWFSGSRFVKVGQSNASGLVSLTGLPAGTYWVAVEPHFLWNDWEMARRLAELRPTAQRVTIEEDTPRDVVFRIR